MKENVYFDNAGTSWPKPEAVYRFIDSFNRSHGVNPGRGAHLLAVEADQMITATRSMLARFFGFDGPSERVVFTHNGTDSLNIAVGGLLAPGDHVVTTRLEHNAVLRMVNHLERDGNLAVTRVAPDASGYVTVEAIESVLTERTRAIVLNHASNVIGTLQPLDDIAALARHRAIPLIVDAAQTAGVIPINMQSLGIAALAFPGHKGLFGPMGVGGLIVAENIELAPTRFGGTGVDSISHFQPDAYPHRLEAGTLPLPGIAGLHAAQKWFRELGQSVSEGDSPGTTSDHSAELSDWMLCGRAQQHIHQVEMQHVNRIESFLSQFAAVRIVGKAHAEARVATLSFTVTGHPAQEIADRLDADHHVCCRAGLQCAPLVHRDADTVDDGGTVRLSPGYFTDEDDMSQLLEGLGEVLSDNRSVASA